MICNNGAPMTVKCTTFCLWLAILDSFFWFLLVLEYPYTLTQSGKVTFWEIPSLNQDQLFKLRATLYRKAQIPLHVDWWVGGGSISVFLLLPQKYLQWWCFDSNENRHRKCHDTYVSTNITYIICYIYLLYN